MGFSETLSSALRLADEEARKLGQEFVGTEHLLLGILAAKSGDAFRALDAETDVNQLRRILVTKLPKAGKAPLVTGRLPLSPKAQRVINSAMSAAQSADEENVSTRFVLLGLLTDPDAAAGQALLDGASPPDDVSQALRDSGADLDELRGLLSDPAGDGEQ
jgi:ATP-dependent Clp protease ATP-binding subunit ClpC